MSKQLEHMKRRIAQKMGGRRAMGFGHGDAGPHRHRMTKEFAGDFFRAKRDKKKLPKISHRGVREKNPEYAKLSIDQFLRKYPEWKV